MSQMSTASVLHSAHLGPVEWDESSELFLPFGFPGFSEERRMVPIEIPAQRPLVFLQSAHSEDVCFVALPIRVIDPAFELTLNEDDRAALLLPPECEPEIGTDVLCLALLLPSPGSVAVNLNTPIVVNLHNARCIQSISPQSGLRYVHLTGGKWVPAC